MQDSSQIEARFWPLAAQGPLNSRQAAMSTDRSTDGSVRRLAIDNQRRMFE